jgi:O-antigen ligase
MVMGGEAWVRLWSALGLAAGAIYLAVLPIGHTAGLRSVAFVLAVASAIALWVRPARRLLPVFGAFAAWLAFACLSLLSTRDFAASVEAIENEVLRSLIIFGTFYVLGRRSATAVPVWTIATALGFGALSTVAIASFFAYGKWRYHYVAPLGDYATSAITVLPLLAGYLAFRRPSAPVAMLLAISIFLTLWAGFLTMSRGFWLVLICGLVLAAGLSASGQRRLKKRSMALVATVCLAAVALAAVAAMHRGRPLVDFEAREIIYSVSIAKIPGNPLTGTGYGHETDKEWYAAAMPGWSIFHPHNIFISYIDQMGFLGALAVIMIFGAPSWVFWRVLRTSSTREARVAALCGLVLVACVFVKNNLDFFFWKHNLWLFFAQLGIYFGAIDRSLGAPPAAGR